MKNETILILTTFVVDNLNVSKFATYNQGMYMPLFLTCNQSLGNN